MNYTIMKNLTSWRWRLREIRRIIDIVISKYRKRWNIIRFFFFAFLVAISYMQFGYSLLFTFILKKKKDWISSSHCCSTLLYSVVYLLLFLSSNFFLLYYMLGFVFGLWLIVGNTVVVLDFEHFSFHFNYF